MTTRDIDQLLLRPQELWTLAEREREREREREKREEQAKQMNPNTRQPCHYQLHCTVPH